MDVKIYQAIVEQSLKQKAQITDAEYKDILVQIFINKFNSYLVNNILLYLWHDRKLIVATCVTGSVTRTLS
jgi:hypothetical protein